MSTPKKTAKKPGGRAHSRNSRARGGASATNSTPDALQVRTAKAQARFLAQFAVYDNVLRACKAAKVGRRTIYDWLKADEAFKALYIEATDDAVDALEDEARRRAVEGVIKPVYQGGEKVGEIQEYSDTLLVFLLKGKRPDVYRERMEHTGKNGQPIRTETKVTFGGRYKPSA